MPVLSGSESAAGRTAVAAAAETAGCRAAGSCARTGLAAGRV